MSQPKAREIGKLQYSEADGLVCQIRDPKELAGLWLEVLPNSMEWPGVEKTQKLEAYHRALAAHDWRELQRMSSFREYHQDLDAYLRALHADPTYRQAAKEFVERQRLEPQVASVWLFSDYVDYWVCKDTVFQVDSDISPDADTARLLIKHFMLKRSRYYERIRREVEALENLEKLQCVEREPIPEAVRLFVWQRDKGQCVKCGSRQRLEFAHIIPVAAGGSNTERNIQLLCESCNRSKGSTI